MSAAMLLSLSNIHVATSCQLVIFYASIEEGSVLKMWQNLEQQNLADPRTGEFLNENANK
jgi:hypothetical protein